VMSVSAPTDFFFAAKDVVRTRARSHLGALVARALLLSERSSLLCSSLPRLGRRFRPSRRDIRRHDRRGCPPRRRQSSEPRDILQWCLRISPWERSGQKLRRYFSAAAALRLRVLLRTLENLVSISCAHHSASSASRPPSAPLSLEQSGFRRIYWEIGSIPTPPSCSPPGRADMHRATEMVVASMTIKTRVRQSLPPLHYAEPRGMARGSISRRRRLSRFAQAGGHWSGCDAGGPSGQCDAAHLLEQALEALQAGCSRAWRGGGSDYKNLQLAPVRQTRRGRSRASLLPVLGTFNRLAEAQETIARPTYGEKHRRCGTKM